MSDLRSRTIRLAYTNPAVRPYLVELLVTDRVAMEFDSQEALEKYLKDHPGADKSKHTVKKDDGGKGKSDGESSLGSRLRENVRAILFDDFKDAWSESKKAYNDIVSSVKPKANRQDIVGGLKSSGTATKTFFSNRKYRREKMRDLGKSIKDGAKAIGARIAHAAKSEVHEVMHGAKALKQVLTPGSKPLDKKQKKAMYALGAYAAGAAVTAAGGGALMAAGALGKSFATHVGIKAISHLADSFFVHYEWGLEASHAAHGASHVGKAAWEVMSRFAAEKDGGKDDDAGYTDMFSAVVVAVSKALEDGMDDDAVKAMLEGEDDDRYDDADIPAIDKLQEKGAKAGKDGKSDKGGKSDKDAALRRRVIRLAHSRPDLRPHLLAALV